MAILTNRIKSTNTLFEFIRFILLILKRFLALIFVVFLLNSLYFSKSQFVNKVSLEIVGHFITPGLVLYEKIFKHVKSFATSLAYLQDLEIENIELKIEIDKLKKLRDNYNAIKVENIALKKLLQFVETNKYKYITAKLLSVSLNSFSNVALVGAGKNHGVEINQIVVNEEGLVGRIIETSDNYSKIMLVEDFNSRIPVVTSISRERAILSGNNGKMQMMYLQDNHSVTKGEKVLTSGDGEVYSEGIAVAEVIMVNKGHVVLKPIAKLYNSDFVSIYTQKP